MAHDTLVLHRNAHIVGEARPRQAATRQLPIRDCAGIMLMNRFGQIWLGRRAPKWHADKSACIWQMPQGGITDGEKPIEALLFPLPLLFALSFLQRLRNGRLNLRGAGMSG